MVGQAEVEAAKQGCDGGGQDELRQGHAYAGAGATAKGQRPPHLLTARRSLQRMPLWVWSGNSQKIENATSFKVQP